jgi:hypothetical protein
MTPNLAMDHCIHDISKHRMSSGSQFHITKTIKLTDLPNELLLHIAANLRVSIPRMDKEERFDGIQRVSFVWDAKTLISLSKMCKRLHAVAQEVLLHTVVLGGFDGLPATLSLVRLLLHRPEMRRHVRRLRIGLPPNEMIYLANNKGYWTSKPLGPPPLDIWPKAAEVAASSLFPVNVKESWQRELSSNYARPLCGVLIALVPNLEFLSISHSLGRASCNGILQEMFGIRDWDAETDVSVLPALAKSKYFNDLTIMELRPTLVLPPVSFDNNGIQGA